MLVPFVAPLFIDFGKKKRKKSATKKKSGASDQNNERSRFSFDDDDDDDEKDDDDDDDDGGDVVNNEDEADEEANELDGMDHKHGGGGGVTVEFDDLASRETAAKMRARGTNDADEDDAEMGGGAGGGDGDDVQLTPSANTHEASSGLHQRSNGLLHPAFLPATHGYNQQPQAHQQHQQTIQMKNLRPAAMDEESGAGGGGGGGGGVTGSQSTAAVVVEASRRKFFVGMSFRHSRQVQRILYNYFKLIYLFLKAPFVKFVYHQVTTFF